MRRNKHSIPNKYLAGSIKMIVFGTKARTLERLKDQLKSAKILPIFIFTVGDWINDKSNIIRQTSEKLDPGPWIIRSSFSGEDRIGTSGAGAFLSVLNVDSSTLEEAINNVVASYGNESFTEEIFIQPMLKNVELVGVAFSHDPNTGSPDRIINWSKGPDTQAVTAGLAGNIWQIAAGHQKIRKGVLLEPVVHLLDELSDIFRESSIDCEFAIVNEKKRRTLYLLQVRPLLITKAPKSVSKHLGQLNVIKNKIKTGMKTKPFLMGKRTVYGIMPDWNPAEIIGRRPKPLAMSLYQELITNSIWAYQRHNYGYRNLRSYPLMISLSGVPYVDVRVSVNSFVPCDLGDDLAGRLVDYYINKLVSKPSLHDKLEFEIVFSCYTFDLQKKLLELKEYGFSKSDQNCIAESLLKLTNQILHPEMGLWRKDVNKLDILNTKFQTVKESNLTSIEKIYWYLEDCKRYGTLPFAGLARAAFIGVQILNSLVNLQVLSKVDYRDFMESVSTVSSQMIFDKKNMNKFEFLKKYGHLRPGTYDILSKRYDAKSEEYFDWTRNAKNPIEEKRRDFTLTKIQINLINKLLYSNGINTDAINLLDFIRKTIELREKAKFDFTRNLSEAMSLIEKVGAENNLTLEELSYSNISVFHELYTASSNIKEVLLLNIMKGKSQFKDSLSLSLPPLITKPDDVFSFSWPNADPSFITQKKVIAAVTTSTEKDKIANNIVCIPSADPGFDWIFSYPISGLVTAWGGANSHMAIRAGEQRVPAVIGAGEVLFRQWSSSERLMIDCAEQRVEIIK